MHVSQQTFQFPQPTCFWESSVGMLEIALVATNPPPICIKLSIKLIVCTPYAVSYASIPSCFILIFSNFDRVFVVLLASRCDSPSSHLLSLSRLVLPVLCLDSFNPLDPVIIPNLPPTRAVLPSEYKLATPY